MQKLEDLLKFLSASVALPKRRVFLWAGWEKCLMFAVSKRYDKLFIGIYLMVRRDILSGNSRGKYPSAVVVYKENSALVVRADFCWFSY